MATKISVYREAARLLGDARLATLTDDSTQRHAFDDAWASTVEFVLRQAYWNFALRTVVPDDSAVPPVIGYSEVFDLPCDWLRTHALFVPRDGDGAEPGHEYPFDCRFQAEQIHTNVTPIYMRYITSDAADPELWPEHFSNAVAARLAYETAERITGNPARTDQMFQLWGEALSRAAPVDAVPVNPWLIHQLDGTFETSSRTILQAGNWRFALKSATLTADVAPAPFPGFDDSYAKPADWVRTQALFLLGGTRELPIDAREHGSSWSANVDPTVRYVSSDYLDARTWPEDFRRVVIAHLGVDMGDDGGRVNEQGQPAQGPLMWPEYLKAALARDAVQEDPWLRFQFDGSLQEGTRFLLDQAHWRFAMKTAELTATADTPSIGYQYAFDKPDDHGRTFHLYRRFGTCWNDIDFRDEGGQFHANHDPIVLRYVSTDGEAAVSWSDGFERTLLAYLEFEETKRTPGQSGAQVAAREAAFKESFKNARIKDDMTERPRWKEPSRLVQARSGGSGRFGMNREMGW